MSRRVNLFPLDSRTASENSPDIDNWEGSGVVLTIAASDKAATPSVVFTIQGKEPATGQYYDILSSAAVTTSGLPVTLRVYPGAPDTANVSVNDALPEIWRVKAVAADSDSLTYAVTANMI